MGGGDGPDGAAGMSIPDPRAGRFDALVAASRMAMIVAVGNLAVALAVAGSVLPGDAGTWAATAAIVVVIAAPLLRVTWLAARWFRRGDITYAWVAVGVLCVVATAVVLAAL